MNRWRARQLGKNSPCQAFLWILPPNSTQIRASFGHSSPACFQAR